MKSDSLTCDIQYITANNKSTKKLLEYVITPVIGMFSFGIITLLVRWAEKVRTFPYAGMIADCFTLAFLVGVIFIIRLTVQSIYQYRKTCNELCQLGYETHEMALGIIYKKNLSPSIKSKRVLSDNILMCTNDGDLDYRIKVFFKDGTTENYKLDVGNYVLVNLEKSPVEKIEYNSGVYSKLGDFLYMLMAPIIALLPYHMFDKFTFPENETIKKFDIPFDTTEKYGDVYLLTLEKVEEKRKKYIIKEKRHLINYLAKVFFVIVVWLSIGSISLLSKKMYYNGIPTEFLSVAIVVGIFLIRTTLQSIINIIKLRRVKE